MDRRTWLLVIAICVGVVWVWINLLQIIQNDKPIKQKTIYKIQSDTLIIPTKVNTIQPNGDSVVMYVYEFDILNCEDDGK